MANLTTCSQCGRCYEAGSEEQANEPDRRCRTCVFARLDREAERLDPGHLRRVQQETLWAAINRYVTACAGDPSRYGSTERQNAVVAVEQAIEQTARFHSGSGVQPHPSPCATRTVGSERAVCVYLRDGGKIVVRRDPGVTGAVWLEVVEQNQVTPCYALLQPPDPRPCGLPDGHEGGHQP